MKKFLGAFAMAFSLAAFANDSGAYLIDVKGVNPENGQAGAGYVSAQDGTAFIFRGPEAVNLAKKLPPIYSVTPTTDKYFREINLVSAGWQLIIGCRTADSGENGPIPYENYAECSIYLWSLREIGAPEGDTSPFKDLEYTVADADRNVEKIKVDLIEPQRKAVERFEEVPVAKSGTKITFYGKDVEQFLRLMPDSKKYVIEGEGRPADGLDNRLTISCEKAKDPADSKCSVEYKEFPR